jgi:hypothetical protein
LALVDHLQAFQTAAVLLRESVAQAVDDLVQALLRLVAAQVLLQSLVQAPE